MRTVKCVITKEDIKNPFRLMNPVSWAAHRSLPLKEGYCWLMGDRHLILAQDVEPCYKHFAYIPLPKAVKKLIESYYYSTVCGEDLSLYPLDFTLRLTKDQWEKVESFLAEEKGEAA